MPTREPNNENLHHGQINLQDRPSDSDRRRFGFKLRKPPLQSSSARESPEKQDAPRAVVAKADGVGPSSPFSPSSVTTTSSDGCYEINLTKVCHDTVGDPDEVMAVLKMKPVSGAYEFKEKIAEYKGMITPLKNALSDQRLKIKSLVNALVALEEDINEKLRDASSQRDALKEARKEVADRKASQAKLQSALGVADRDREKMREAISSESRRANEAETQLAEAKQEIEKSRSEARKSAVKASELEKNLESFKQDCKSQIHQAETLLQQQIGSSQQDQQQLITMHQEKEAYLQAERDKCQLQIGALECELKETAAARDEFFESREQLHSQVASLINTSEETEASLRADIQNQLNEMKAKEASLQADLCAKLEKKEARLARKEEELRSQYSQQLEALEEKLRNHQADYKAKLAEKERQLLSHEKQAQNDLEEVRKLHQVQTEEKDRALMERLQQKDAGHNEAMATMKLSHRTQLEEKDLIIAQGECDAGESLEALKKTHQVQLSSMEELMRQKDEDSRAALTSLRAQHAAQLNEKHAQLKEKEADTAESMAHLQSLHDAQLAEKDNLMKWKEEDSKDSLSALRARHQVQSERMEELLKQKDASMKEAIDSTKQACKIELEEKDELLKKKDAELKDHVERMKKTQEAQLTEKDDLLLQKESAFKEATESMRCQHQIQIRELEDVVKRKDASLHESLQSMQLMQSSSNDQLQLERQRAQRLEDEVQKLRNTEVELRAASSQQTALHQSAMNTSREQIAELRLQQQRIESEKDQQLERASERQASLQEEITQLKCQGLALQEELAAIKSESSAKSRECERISQQRDSLEVEFHSYKEHHGTSNLQQMEAITDLKLTVDKLNKVVDNKVVQMELQQSNISQHRGYIQTLEGQLASADGIRRELHNTIQELKGNIRVFCRVRPQLGDGDAALNFEANKLSVLCMKETHAFNFDRVFDPSSRQEDVFNEVDGLVQSALDGYKVCIFAYGQTGSGKTFTMQGTPDSWGMIPRSLQKIFQASEGMRAAGWQWTLRASFLEVYNEALRDLLSSDSDGLVHVIKHDDAWGAVVTNLTTIEVTGMEQIQKLMEKAGKARAVGATDMNATSSRSHSVFALYLHGVNSEINSELHGALHLVDLAGSERLDRSNAVGDRLKETQNINRSLSSLADVFLAKSECRSHVPFRNSKLTHLMEPCLNGNGKTLMVVNVGPESENAHETLCSLRFAGQVSQCTTGGKPKRSTKPASAASKLTPTATPRVAGVPSRKGK